MKTGGVLPLNSQEGGLYPYCLTLALSEVSMRQVSPNGFSLPAFPVITPVIQFYLEDATADLGHCLHPAMLRVTQTFTNPFTSAAVQICRMATLFKGSQRVQKFYFY